MKEAAEYLRVSLRTIERLVGERTIPSYAVSGRFTRLKKEDIDSFVEGHKREAV
jgi:excisionase family DNA binding protein